VSDPNYYAIISRETVTRLAEGSDAVGVWARKMLEAFDEEAEFLRGAQVFFNNTDRDKRRFALASLASTFGAKREDLKRYLRFKGLVNLMD
jgi:hypothetical protein